MRTDAFDYHLPEELIAQSPAEPRDSCRLLVLHRESGRIEHRTFREIITYLNKGDLLVVNETRVLPARLLGRKRHTGGQAELLLLKELESDSEKTWARWECLVKPGKRLKQRAVIEFGSEAQKPLLTATIEGFTQAVGGRVARLEAREDLDIREAINQVGVLPLPPYIKDYQGDQQLYQTIYAQKTSHSAAAPTAGLHFTPQLLDDVKAKGIDLQKVELEVGIDTFRLVTTDNVEDHRMHSERYHVSQRVVDQIRETKARGGRVIAVGTTSVRSLESAWDEKRHELVAREDAMTNLFLYPGKAFHVVDAMITNFHVPRSSLMMLVSAFASQETIMQAYEAAVDQRYRMLSFGDAMLIL